MRKTIINGKQVRISDDRQLWQELVDGKWSEQDNLDRVRRSRGVVSVGTQSQSLLLYVGWNQRVEVMKDISHIRFTRLAVLSLVGNMIDSIEGIEGVTVPYLRDLILSTLDTPKVTTTSGVSENSENQCGPLLSAHRQLIFNLENNPFLTLPTSPKGFSKLTHLQIDNEDKSSRFSDHCFLAKLQSLSLSQLCGFFYHSNFAGRVVFHFLYQDSCSAKVETYFNSLILRQFPIFLIPFEQVRISSEQNHKNTQRVSVFSLLVC